MEAPSPSYILSRAIFLIAVIVGVIFCVSFVKKRQRQNAIIANLESITQESSFFKQFYSTDAKTSLAKAVALIAEASTVGMTPEETISRAIGVKKRFFADQTIHQDPPLRQQIIRNCLRTNYQNFLKLGFQPTFQTLQAFKSGELPAIPSGPDCGQHAVIAQLIEPSVAPGIDKVIANYEIRPPRPANQQPSSIELSAIKELAYQLSEARVIDDPVRDRILERLNNPPAPTP